MTAIIETPIGQAFLRSPTRTPPAGTEGRTLEVLVKASQGDLESLPDSGIDDISRTVEGEIAPWGTSLKAAEKPLSASYGDECTRWRVLKLDRLKTREAPGDYSDPNNRKTAQTARKLASVRCALWPG